MLADLCNSLDELSNEEKAAELLPIEVQQLYVLIRLGKIQEAERLASEIGLEQYGNVTTHVVLMLSCL